MGSNLYVPEWWFKSEMTMMNDIMRNYQRTWGENVLWFEYDQLSATKNDVYDEGPSRAWFPPSELPVMFLEFRQDDPINTDEGFYTLSTATVTFQVSVAHDRFRFSPLLTAAHFRDRFSYDSRHYRVAKYEKQGFVHGQYLTITAMGVEIKSEEIINDMQQADFFTQTMTQ